MDKSTFQRELGKYKIVRLEDYCRSREKRTETKRIESHRPVPSEGPRVKLNVAAQAETQSFWELITAASRELLTEKETEAFLAELRKNYTDVPELINLEDLNFAASLI